MLICSHNNIINQQKISLRMDIKFCTKFKDKIRYITKKGVKQTLYSQPNQQLNQMKQYKKTGMSKLSQLKNTKQMLLNTPTVQKKHNNSKTLNILNQSFKSGNYIKKADNQHMPHLSKIHSYNQTYREVKDIETQLLSRNPEVEYLAIKLKQKEKKRYRQTRAPKFIDQMLIKHQNLLKIIDHKTYVKSNQIWKQQLSEEQQETSRSNYKNRKRIDDSRIIESRSINSIQSHDQLANDDQESPKVIRLKKIQQLIRNTKINIRRQKNGQISQQGDRISKSVSPKKNSVNVSPEDKKLAKSHIKPIIKIIQDNQRGVKTLQQSRNKYDIQSLQNNGFDTLETLNISSSNNSFLADQTHHKNRKLKRTENPYNPLPKIRKPWDPHTHIK